MRALLDTNVLLDLVLARDPFVSASRELWEANRAGRYVGHISAITPATVYYLTRRNRDKDTAFEAVRLITLGLRTCTVDGHVLRVALTLPLSDYEDAVQLASALAAGLDVIVTRDLKDFVGSSLPVFFPADFLAQLPAASGESSG